tara:strand:- start:22465 stop:23163 length:699 start_codon:yes stop_codon:yes gene_type:complete
MRIILSFILLLFVLTACTVPNGTALAPVVDARAQMAMQQGYYDVHRGETIYFIAWRLDADPIRIAQANGLVAPYKVHAGERLRIPRPGETITPPKRQPGQSRPARLPQLPNVPVGQWQWPTRGTVINNFSSQTNGINVAGPLGQSIVAAASGEVVYSGNGLPSYGNVIIIKNNDTYMSVYAHCQQIQVKEGQRVKAGQQIATMGSSGTNRVMLHFEIRKRGKAVNPLQYLGH